MDPNRAEISQRESWPAADAFIARTDPPPAAIAEAKSLVDHELREERAQRRMWEMRYLSLEHAVVDAGHDPYVPCALAGEGCPLCATVRRLRAAAP